MSELIGQEIAGFRIDREIARGGMGVVFEAEQVRLGRPVAIKMLHPALTVDSDFLRRFEHEAKTLARLNHEGIVSVIDFFHQDNRYFLALEFVEGETLSRRLRRCSRRRRYFSLGEAGTFAWQIAQALSFAHANKIIHRDLKPDNIMLTPRGRAKVMDFGIARIIGSATHTEVGTRIGTPDYMAPEQLRGVPADERSDLFALGLIFYEMLAGRRPLSQANLLHHQDVEQARIDWDLETLPIGIDRVRPIIERLLALKPDDRYSSANALLEEMRERMGTEILGDEAWTTPPSVAAEEPEPQPVADSTGPHPPRMRWRSRLAIAAAVLALLIGVFFYNRWEQSKLELKQRRLEATMANFQAFIADSQGRLTEARNLFMQAIDLDPSVARHWRDLGDFSYKHEDPEDAAFYYRKTLELDPSDETTRQRLREIEALLSVYGPTD